MAENKKSFILHADYIHTVKKLSKEKAGELFVLILEYVNDLNPIPQSELIEIAFEPIKQQLKRNLREWEKTREKRAKSGSLGGVKSGISRNNEANEANASKTKQTKQKQANEAVSVSVSDKIDSNNSSSSTSEQFLKICEYLRGAAPISIGNPEIEQQARELMKNYAGKKIGNMRALCNTWMSNYQDSTVLPQTPKNLNGIL